VAKPDASGGPAGGAGAATAGSDALTPTPTTATQMSPRAALAAEIAAHVARLLAAGDLEGARIAHDAMGRLLAAEGPASGGAAVLDLAEERRRRER
jgi:hypothetical protein